MTGTPPGLGMPENQPPPAEDGERSSEEAGQPEPSHFERLVSALIRVDPRGIAGKHRKEPEAENDGGPDR